jgi:hypothetical protein
VELEIIELVVNISANNRPKRRVETNFNKWPEMRIQRARSSGEMHFAIGAYVIREITVPVAALTVPVPLLPL